MIDSDKQRRWWFANHPEYSNSHKGKRNRHDNDGRSDQERVSPEGVDAYVDEALKYLDGPEAELLKSVKRNFGTEAEAKGGSSWNAEARAGAEQTAQSRPEEDDSYWEGYHAARKLIWNREQLPPCDSNDDSPYAQGFGKGVSDAYNEAVAARKLWQAFKDTWDTLTSWVPFIGSSRALRNNLEKTGNPRPDNHAAHHIVAENDPRAVKSREILANFRIKLDDAINGAHLPNRPGIGAGAYHPAVHPNKYHLEVENLLRQARTKEEAIAILQKIGIRLSNGTFPK